MVSETSFLGFQVSPLLPVFDFGKLLNLRVL